MKKTLFVLLVIFLLINTAIGKTLRIELNAELRSGDQRTGIFDAQLSIPEGETIEIFTGAYTLELSLKGIHSPRYEFHSNYFGLAPNYNLFESNFDITSGEKSMVSSLPVKNGSYVEYTVTLLDDTTEIEQPKFPLGDTTYWREAETVHYKTHWVKGSLFDYKWGNVMRHLEFELD